MTRNIALTRKFLTLDDVDVAGKAVVVRMDLNVPMVSGRVTDASRVVRLLPTLKELRKKKAKIVILSHLGRPNGTYEPDLSLAPLVDVLSKVMGDVLVRFGVDCIGSEAEQAVAALKPGEILLLENLRFHPAEEANDKEFARKLASYGDLYINDAFSCSHRPHASVDAITHYLPSIAGRLMEEELTNLESLFTDCERPLTAIAGGSKVSTKLELLENLITKVDNLIIGGAMANTFLIAMGCNVGASLSEPTLTDTARRVLTKAKASGCAIHLPVDAITAQKFAEHAPCSVVAVAKIPRDEMMLDVGPDTLHNFATVIRESKTLIWNGPLGAFETCPFDASTVMLARVAARQTMDGKLKSVAGGGDTVAALSHAGLAERFSYLSTAGGAFLEWMEGRTLPGVAALQKAQKAA